MGRVAADDVPGLLDLHREILSHVRSRPQGNVRPAPTPRLEPQPDPAAPYRATRKPGSL